MNHRKRVPRREAGKMMLNALVLRSYRSFDVYRMTGLARVNLVVGKKQLRQDVHS